MKPSAGGCWPTETQEKLLQAALCEGEVALDAWREWSNSVDRQNIDGASRRLLPLVRHNLKRLGVQSDMEAELHLLTRRALIGNRMILAHGAELLRALHEAAIPTLVFKGAALMLRYYDTPALRPMNDFDLLVPTAQANQAFKWLLSQGWSLDSKSDPSQLTDIYLENLHGHSIRKGDGQSFDVHRHLLHQCSGATADSDFWDASVPLEIDGVMTRTLCTSDHLLATLIHGVHWESTAPLHRFADAMIIMNHAADEIDWERIYTQAQKRGLQLPLHAGLSYLKNAFNAPIPDALLFRLEKLPVTRWQKMEYHGWTTSHENHSPLMRLYLRYLWFCKWDISRGWKGKSVGLFIYLQHAWKLSSPLYVPLYAYTRTIRQVRSILQSRFR